MGFLTTIFGAWVSLQDFQQAGNFVLVVMLLAGSAAVTDVVVDGAMVTQAKLDPKGGSEDLQAFSWGSAAVGGICGLLWVGHMTQIGYSKESFFVAPILGMTTVISSIFLDVKSDIKKTYT